LTVVPDLSANRVAVLLHRGKRALQRCLAESEAIVDACLAETAP
jgi:DNA-directed RNA polymerase specialized sigma24 family protein